jgi:hypothetical protein
MQARPGKARQQQLLLGVGVVLFTATVAAHSRGTILGRAAAEQQVVLQALLCLLLLLLLLLLQLLAAAAVAERITARQL